MEGLISIDFLEGEGVDSGFWVGKKRTLLGGIPRGSEWRGLLIFFSILPTECGESGFESAAGAAVFDLIGAAASIGVGEGEGPGADFRVFVSAEVEGDGFAHDGDVSVRAEGVW